VTIDCKFIAEIAAERILKIGQYMTAVPQQESRSVTKKWCHAAAIRFGLKFTDNIHYSTRIRVAKLRKPCFRAPKIPVRNRI